jgi:hypothetical protein
MAKAHLSAKRPRVGGKQPTKTTQIQALSSDDLSQVGGGTLGAAYGLVKKAVGDQKYNKLASADDQGLKDLGNLIVNVAKATPIGAAINGVVQAAKTHSVGNAFKAIGTSVADSYSHGFASKVIDPLAAGKKGADAAKAIAIGVGTTAAENASRGISKLAVSTAVKAAVKGAAYGVRAAASPNKPRTR